MRANEMGGWCQCQDPSRMSEANNRHNKELRTLKRKGKTFMREYKILLAEWEKSLEKSELQTIKTAFEVIYDIAVKFFKIEAAIQDMWCASEDFDEKEFQKHEDEVFRCRKKYVQLYSEMKSRNIHPQFGAQVTQFNQPNDYGPPPMTEMHFILDPRAVPNMGMVPNPIPPGHTNNMPPPGNGFVFVNNPRPPMVYNPPPLRPTKPMGMPQNVCASTSAGIAPNTNPDVSNVMRETDSNSFYTDPKSQEAWLPPQEHFPVNELLENIWRTIPNEKVAVPEMKIQQYKDPKEDPKEDSKADPKEDPKAGPKEDPKADAKKKKKKLDLQALARSQNSFFTMLGTSEPNIMSTHMPHWTLPETPFALHLADISLLDEGVVGGYLHGDERIELIRTKVADMMDAYCKTEQGRWPYVPIVNELCVVKAPYKPAFRAFRTPMDSQSDPHHVHVYYIDYGYAEHVPIAHMRKMQPEFVQELPSIIEFFNIADFPPEIPKRALFAALNHIIQGKNGPCVTVTYAREIEDGTITITIPELLDVISANMSHDAN